MACSVACRGLVITVEIITILIWVFAASSWNNLSARVEVSQVKLQSEVGIRYRVYSSLEVQSLPPFCLFK